MKKLLQKNYKDIIALVILSIGLLIYKQLLGTDFGSPLAGKIGDHGDGLLSEQMAFFFRKNLTFNIIPVFNLNSDWIGFPYGLNAALQSWQLEGCWFNYFAWKFTGKPFGWLGLYYHITVALNTFLLFLLFRKEKYSTAKSTIAVIIAVFFNFFAIFIYPAHLFYSVVQWAMIGLALDFFLLKRIVNTEEVSATFLLTRVCILILTFGQDLGYIASISMLFFIITVLFALGISVYRIYSKDKKYLSNIGGFFKNLIISFKRKLKINIGLSILLLVIIYFYIPPFIQLYLSVLSLGNVNDFQPPALNNPLRFVMPYTPYFNPFNCTLSIFRGGTYNNDFAIGLTLFIIGVVSVSRFSKKQWLLVYPIILFVVIFFLHNTPPFYYPILKNFFWLKHIRVPGRVTLFLSTLIAVLFLTADFNLRKHKVFVLFLGLFGMLELYTFYSGVASVPLSKFPNNFFSFMNTVKAQKGEAIFDFPICIIGGNGIGELTTKEKTCRLYEQNAFVSGFQIFHEKKVFNFYTGRLTETQFDTYRNRKWHEAAPSDGDPFTNKKLSQCPDSTSMAFLKQFIQLNDFAGINLYPDLLPDGCAEKFYEIFGKPIAEANGLDLGRIQFIPKRKEWSPLTDPVKGKALKYDCKCR